MGVIDEDRRAVALGDPLEPALGAFQQFERGEYRFRLAAGADRKPRRHQRILDLEFADQRQPHLIIAAAMFERQLLRKAVDVGANQANALAGAIALAADRDDPQFACPRRIDHLLRAVMIRRDHRGAIGRHQIAEQPQFCVEIMRDIGMVIHVVAREIGKTAGGDPHAVEPILIEPVRRGLEREMGDALAGDVVELPVQRDRIRRGQRSVDGALRRHQPDGADAGRFVTEPLPDLAREGGDRGLAAGAGDRRDGAAAAADKISPPPAPARGAGSAS